MLYIDFPEEKSYTCHKKEVNPVKNIKIPELLFQLASPAALILLGLVLIVSPDSAAILVARLLGWGLTLVGIGFGIAAILDRNGAVKKGITAVLFVCAGGTLSANPLVLAAFVGRIIGVLIVVRGVRDLLLCSSYGYSRSLALITVAVGIVLVVLPMTTSRLVFSLCGIVVLLIGVGMLLDRLKHRNRLSDGKKDIIDAL